MKTVIIIVVETGKIIVADHWPESNGSDPDADISDAEEKNLLSWNGIKPEIQNPGFSFREPFLAVEIPWLTLPLVFSELQKGKFDIMEKPQKVFQDLDDNGYSFVDFIKKNMKYFYIFRRKS